MLHVLCVEGADNILPGNITAESFLKDLATVNAIHRKMIIAETAKGGSPFRGSIP